MEFKLKTVPGAIQWLNRPLTWEVQADDRLAITAGPQTDWFVDPAGGFAKDDAPTALFVPTDENFTLRAKLTVDFASTFDAGVLQVRESDSLWAKLCFEFSPQQQPMIVSVVTRDLSDDCNSQPIDGREIYLRVMRKAGIFAFHYARDGLYWHLVRYFTLGPLHNLRLGFSSQSPTGSSCQAIFSEIAYEPKVVKDIRGGE